MNDRLMCRKEVEDMVALKRSTIYKLMDEKKFPAPKEITKRCVRWRESDIQEWICRLPKVK